jgi:hypothetical protein
LASGSASRVMPGRGGSSGDADVSEYKEGGVYGDGSTQIARAVVDFFRSSGGAGR